LARGGKIINFQVADRAPLDTPPHLRRIALDIAGGGPFQHAVADHVLYTPTAGQARVLLVGIDDTSLDVDDHVTCVRRLNEPFVLLLTLPQRFLGGFALGDVRVGAQDAIIMALGVVEDLVGLDPQFPIASRAALMIWYSGASFSMIRRSYSRNEAVCSGNQGRS
jgi:hypothetical protein